jgi:Glycosyl hydrolase family 12
MKISEIDSLEMDASWDAWLSADPSVGVSNLAANGAVFNVIIDLFLDDSPTASTSEVEAGYEVMIWLAWFGTSYPLGWSKGSVWSQTIGGNV